MTYPYPNHKCYYTYDAYLKETFGGKTVRIPLDGGFTCPNRDGTKGRGGCTFCAGTGLPYRGRPLREQFEEARQPLLRKWGRQMETERYLPYFQVFSNTYGPTEKLRALYEEALALPHAVGLSIATRCDCLTDETVSLLRELNEKTHLTVELGLQTVHEKTAEAIGRGHTFPEFREGWRKLEGLRRGVHLIDGLPGETPDMMLETARQVAALRPHLVKIHMLYLEAGTPLGERYRRAPFPLLTKEEYVSVVVGQLEVLPPDTVIGRLTGDGQADRLLAPEWSRKKFCVLNDVDKEFRRRGTRQGCRFSSL